MTTQQNNNQDDRAFLSDKEFDNFRKGEKKVFKKIFDHYYGLIRYVILRCGINADDCSDIVQDTFLKLHINAADIRSLQSIKSWLVTTARNHCLDELRKRKTEIKYSEQVQQNVDSHHNDTLLQEGPHTLSQHEIHELEVLLVGDLINKFESHLSDQTFSCFYCKGMTTKEIAENQNEPISTVTNRLSRYRKQFKQKFENHISTLRDSIL